MWKLDLAEQVLFANLADDFLMQAEQSLHVCFKNLKQMN